MKRLIIALILAASLVAALFVPMVGLISADDEVGGTVNVALSDFTNPAISWAVTATPSSASEDDVAFNVTNISAFISHQFVVIETDLPPSALPRLGPGLGVDESQVDVVGRISVLSAGSSATLSLELGSNYVLICNLNPFGVPFPSHYDNGMFTGFTVTDDDDDDDDD